MNKVSCCTVTGILLRSEFFLNLMRSTARQCFDGMVRCFLLDDGAFVMASSDPADKFKVSLVTLLISSRLNITVVSFQTYIWCKTKYCLLIFMLYECIG